VKLEPSKVEKTSRKGHKGHIHNTVKTNNGKINVVEKAASPLPCMMQDLLDKIEQHLCHEKIQSIKILILT
jgi:hypothetical protein